MDKLKSKGLPPRDEFYEGKTWGLPSNIITFLASAIENKTTQLKYLKLIPWPQFKKELFEIIDHRIEHAYEINGVINTSYMSLDEHLIVYIVQTFDSAASVRENKFGTKQEI